MENSLKLILGLIGGFSLMFVNRVYSGHDFLGGIFGFILNGIMPVLAFFGLVIVEIISILLCIDVIKSILKKNRN